MSATNQTNQHDATRNGAASEHDRQPAASDLRDRLPETGLREYWYPAVAARKVGKRKPRALKLLDDELVLFRDKQGEVAALQNACPHRGML